MRVKMVCLALLGFCSLASADQLTLLTVGGGVVDRGNHNWGGEGRLEYRDGTVCEVLHPWASLEEAWGVGQLALGGFSIDVPITQRILVWPSFGGGLYKKERKSKRVRDLGSVIEFRTMLSVNYRVEGGDLLGAYVSHVSNASISKHNPGANMFGVQWTIML